MPTWIPACRLDDIEPEGVIRFDHAGRTFAIYRSPEDELFCTDGLCTHEAVHLAEGLVMGHEIEASRLEQLENRVIAHGLGAGRLGR